MFDWKKPTVQMLGRWQPWHDGHQELLKMYSKDWSSNNTGSRCKRSFRWSGAG